VYYSTGSYEKLAESLMPVLNGRADMYICGHVHNLQHHKAVDGVNLFVIGASGRGGEAVNAADRGTEWARTAYGFGVLEADAHTFTVRFIGTDGSELHAATLRK
jgi:hypothetical protein